MSAQQAQKSKWGSLFSGAVAGLESRLDNILADEGSAAAKNAEFERRREEAKKARAAASTSPRASPAPGEELASSRVPTASDTLNSTDSSTTKDAATPSSSSVGAAVTAAKAETQSIPEASQARSSTETAAETTKQIQPADQQSEDVPRTSEASSRPSVEGLVSQAETSAASTTPITDAGKEGDGKQEQTPLDLDEQLPRAERGIDETELAQEDEIQGYLERIDALQAKLQYLAKDAAVTARQAAADAANGSAERKLAAKDEQIALLLEEGTKLSKAEVTQAATIRRLRIKMSDDAKAQAEERRNLAKAEVMASGLQDRVSRLETEKKDALSKLGRLARLEKELGDARRERGTKDATIHDLQSQLTAAKKQADENARAAAERALDQEKRVAQSLRDDLSNAKIEQTLRDDRAKAQLKEAQDEIRREQERHRAAEVGFRNEVSTLETRLELMRERSEEASSGSSNDVHAKLMRQVETLQSQYAVASENWQTLESSLQARLTALEEERDEVSRAESEARKKARENGSTARRVQEQLDDVNQRCQVFEQEVSEHRTLADKHLSRATAAEKAAEEQQQKYEAERNAWEAKLQARLEEEKAKWQLSSPKTANNEAPSLLTLGSPREFGQRRTSYMDMTSLMPKRQLSRQLSELSISGYERPSSRRTSTFTSRNAAVSPNGFETERSMPGYDNSQMPETPSVHTVDADERDHESSPHRTVNDMLSGATASAGPTVQLVERMSAAVRRLETEKAATKDEMARLSSQRDEARKEVVNLMREVEQKRSFELKVEKLDKSLAEVNQRYATTLEMLGEKSERVEELQADVADLKKIYRELIESTMK